MKWHRKGAALWGPLGWGGAALGGTWGLALPGSQCVIASLIALLSQQLGTMSERNGAFFILSEMPRLVAGLPSQVFCGYLLNNWEILNLAVSRSWAL